MKQRSKWIAHMIAMVGGLVIVSPAFADTTITTFDDFYSDALYASWATAIIDAGPTAYSITATGYGSNWRYLGTIDGTGNTNIQLTVTLSGPPAADGFLGPIVTLVDADGTELNYAWYGQTLGHHVLNIPISAPTWSGSAGTTSGLDLATLTHLHIQLDPGGFGTTGAYTIAWEDLRLTGAPQPLITDQSYNPATGEFTLTWNSLPGKTYTVQQTASLDADFSPLVTDIPSSGATTTTTVVMPAGDSGFLRIQQQ